MFITLSLSLSLSLSCSHVLVLHFTYERRDRRKREYLLTDSNDKVATVKPIMIFMTLNSLIRNK